MKVTITDEWIEVVTDDEDMPVDQENKIDWSCRLASHEACSWAIKRIGEEMEKSVAFYRTGKCSAKISLD